MFSYCYRNTLCNQKPRCRYLFCCASLLVLLTFLAFVSSMIFDDFNTHASYMIVLFSFDDFMPHLTCTVIHNYRTPSFQPHNVVNIRFISTKISTSEREILLCEVLSEFPHYVLPLPCRPNVCVNVTSERRLGDSVTVSHITLVSVSYTHLTLPTIYSV